MSSGATAPAGRSGHNGRARLFWALSSMALLFLLDGSLRRKRARLHANAVWGSSGRRRAGGECGTGARPRGPARQVAAYASEQKAAGGDPTGAFRASSRRDGRSRARERAGSARSRDKPTRLAGISFKGSLPPVRLLYMWPRKKACQHIRDRVREVVRSFPKRKCQAFALLCHRCERAPLRMPN
jgi:hypothetical protein